MKCESFDVALQTWESIRIKNIIEWEHFRLSFSVEQGLFSPHFFSTLKKRMHEQKRGYFIFLKEEVFLEPTWTNCRKSIKLAHKCIFCWSTLLIIRRIFPGKQESFFSVELAEVYRPEQRYFKLLVIILPSTEIQLWNMCLGRYAWAGERGRLCVCVCECI